MIRRRLVLAVTLAVALAIGVGSWLIVTSLEDRLIANVDDQFGSDLDLRDIVVDRSRPPRRQSVDRRQRVALVQYDADGDIVASLASGTEEDPDPLPDAAGLVPRAGISTVDAVDDGPRYRAIAVPAPGAGTTVVAVSLDSVDETLREARRIQLLVGLAAIAVVGVVCWLLIRKAFSPIDGMIATAGRIAGGDLDERTSVDDSHSEVGRLGTALNTMLDRIQTAVDEKTASEERMRRFVADASHDLRTPLTSVRGYAELYRQGASDPQSVAVGMARIEAEATRMSRLVEDLMVLARLDQRRPTEQRPVDLGRVVGEAVDAARVVDGERTFDLDVETDVALSVSGDADQLRQVFDNLLANATVHTPPGTRVDASVRRSGDTVVVVVSDDGPGFSDADRHRAFDRFWRSTRADENPLDGSGLGLSIVRSILDAHGGSVSLDASPTGGARFTIDLPVAPPPDTSTAHP